MQVFVPVLPPFFPFQTCWLTRWVTPFRTQTSSFFLTASNSTAQPPTCPFPFMPLHLPPPPPPLPLRSPAILSTTTALIAWRPPVIPAPSPTAGAWLRGLERWDCPWGGGHGSGREGRAEARKSCVWCVEIKRQGITTTLLPVRDAKVFLTFQFCLLSFYAVLQCCIVVFCKALF